MATRGLGWYRCGLFAPSCCLFWLGRSRLNWDDVSTFPARPEDFSHPFFGPNEENRERQREVFVRQCRGSDVGDWKVIFE